MGRFGKYKQLMKLKRGRFVRTGRGGRHRRDIKYRRRRGRR